MSDLKPCPFCGGKARPFELTWHAGTFGSHMFEKPFWRVICGECKAAIGDFDSKAEAIAVWNSRAERTCHGDNIGGTCRNQWQWNSGFCCSECFYTVPFVNKFANSPFAYCPNCGCKVVDK